MIVSGIGSQLEPFPKGCVHTVGHYAIATTHAVESILRVVHLAKSLQHETLHVGAGIFGLGKNFPYIVPYMRRSSPGKYGKSLRTIIVFGNFRGIERFAPPIFRKYRRIEITSHRVGPR